MDFSLITDEPLNYCVYAHVNKQNGKVYVGVTNNIKRRWEYNGTGYKGCPHFWNAIEKYGWDSFIHIVIIDNISMEMAHSIERELIKKYDLINKGYNKDPGGKGGDHSHNLGGKKKKPIYQYGLDGVFIKKWDSPIEASISCGVQDVTSAANHGGMSAGYQWSYEYVDKMPPYSNKSNHLYLPIYQYSKDGEFIKKWDKQVDAINKYGISIRNCIYGTARTAMGYRWSDKYVERLQPLPKAKYKPRGKKPDYLKNPNGKYENSQKVYQFGLDGELIQIFDNCAAVAVTIPDIKVSTIYELCIKKYNYVYHNSIWVYEKDAYTGYVQEVIDRHKKLHPKIIQYGLDGSYINTFNSMSELQKEGYLRSNVSKVCNGKAKIANGYQWRYEYDIPPGPISNYKSKNNYVKFKNDNQEVN